jgi:hypothetical protein
MTELEKRRIEKMLKEVRSEFNERKLRLIAHVCSNQILDLDVIKNYNKFAVNVAVAEKAVEKQDE